MTPNYLLFVSAYAISAFTPGLEAATILGTVLAGRRRDVIPLGSGLLVGKVALLLTALLGATALVAVLGPWFTVLRYAGAVWLLWLAYTHARRAYKGAPTPLVEKNPRRAGSSLVVGAALTLGNPLALTFYFAILPTALPSNTNPWSTAPVLVLLVVTVMGIAIASYTVLAHLLLKTLRTHSRAIESISAGLLAVVALAILLT